MIKLRCAYVSIYLQITQILWKVSTNWLNLQRTKIVERGTLIQKTSMNVSNSSTPSSSQPLLGITNFTRFTYSILSIVAMIGNTLVILVFVENKKLLRKSYNILILSLAVSDVMTALLLITNPAFVLGNVFPYPTNHVIGDIFCRFIWSRVILFQLVVFSAYICMALATERWYAVVRPFQYQEVFNKKRTLVYIFLVWLWSLLLVITTPFEVVFVPSNSPSHRCKWKFLWGHGRRRLLRAHHLFRAKSNQLRFDSNGKSATGYQITSFPFSSGIRQQLCESVHIWDKQQELPGRLPQNPVLSVLQRNC